MNDITHIDINKIEEQLLDELTDPKSEFNRGNNHKVVKLSQLQDRSFADILSDAEKSEIREDLFLHATCLEMQSLRERYRHRADMMRRRANEFDEQADELGKLEEAVKEYVFRLVHNLKDHNRVLDAHAHIEPTKVRN